ncbi:hypothetical protein, partial [Singulisphaera acidiphila]
FSYKANDGIVDSNIATIYINVRPYFTYYLIFIPPPCPCAAPNQGPLASPAQSGSNASNPNPQSPVLWNMSEAPVRFADGVIEL